MDWDMIDGLANEAIEAIQNGKQQKALMLLSEIKGHASAMLGISTVWDLVQQDYEAGTRPRDLVNKYRQYDVSVKDIYNRAHAHNWVSPQKIKRAIRPAAGKKNIFYPKCKLCEKEFEAYSGHAIICNTCKAFDAVQGGKRKLKA